MCDSCRKHAAAGVVGAAAGLGIARSFRPPSVCQVFPPLIWAVCTPFPHGQHGGQRDQPRCLKNWVATASAEDVTTFLRGRRQLDGRKGMAPLPLLRGYDWSSAAAGSPAHRSEVPQVHVHSWRRGLPLEGPVDSILREHPAGNFDLGRLSRVLRESDPARPRRDL